MRFSKSTDTADLAPKALKMRSYFGPVSSKLAGGGNDGDARFGATA